MMVAVLVLVALANFAYSAFLSSINAYFFMKPGSNCCLSERSLKAYIRVFIAFPNSPWLY